jgi:hypothetical protein
VSIPSVVGIVMSGSPVLQRCSPSTATSTRGAAVVAESSLLKLYLPWLPLMVIGFVMQTRALLRNRDDLAVLSVVWVICVLVPFSLIEWKVLRYIMPAFPAFSLLCATPLNRWVSMNAARINMKVVYLFLIIAALLVPVFSGTRIRARDMRVLAPIADNNTTQDQRVLIYTYGEPRSDYINQFLWYSNRFCDHPSDVEDLIARLDPNQPSVVIMDKPTYDSIAGPANPVLRQKRKKRVLEYKLEVLGESENFVCFKAILSPA